MASLSPYSIVILSIAGLGLGIFCVSSMTYLNERMPINNRHGFSAGEEQVFSWLTWKYNVAGCCQIESKIRTAANHVLTEYLPPVNHIVSTGQAQANSPERQKTIFE